MTNESKSEAHGHSGQAEFLALVENLGIDPGAMVDPRTEMIFAMARRGCSACTSKEKCRRALRQRVVTFSDVARFCPSADVFVDLLRRQPYGRPPMATSPPSCDRKRAWNVTRSQDVMQTCRILR
jgi:hypothetical protein